MLTIGKTSTCAEQPTCSTAIILNLLLPLLEFHLSPLKFYLHLFSYLDIQATLIILLKILHFLLKYLTILTNPKETINIS